MKNVLITGGAGFIGSNLAKRLVKEGFSVTVLDNLSAQIHGAEPEQDSYLYKSLPASVRFIKGCVTSERDWRQALKDQDVVIHLAAETGTGQSMYQIDKYVTVNVRGTAIMLDLLANEKTGVQKVIVASSRSIYGEGKYWSEELGKFVYPSIRSEKALDAGIFEVQYPGVSTPLELVPTDEDSRIHPNSVYGITKQNQEQMVMLVCPSLGIDAVALRFQNVYGPGQSLSNPYTGILSIFSTLINNGKTINIFEDGLESRDFVFIDDVVESIYLGMTKAAASGEVFNVGSGVRTSVLTVAQTLVDSYGKPTALKVSGNYRVGDIRHNYADLTKVRALLGFEPKVDFAEGIRAFTSWVSSQEVVASRYEESIVEMKEKGLFK